MKVAEAFEVLGLETDAYPEDVLRAWRNAAKELHPDVAPNCQEEFELAQQAYKIALAASKVCPLCKGDGEVAQVRGFRTYTVPCGPCDGRGTR